MEIQTTTLILANTAKRLAASARRWSRLNWVGRGESFLQWAHCHQVDMIALLLSTGLCQRALVVLDSKLLSNTHSQFLGLLSSKYETTVINSRAEPKLQEFGEYLYDLMFVVGLSDPSSLLKHTAVIKFFDDGHQILVISDLDITRVYRKVFFGLGVEPSELGTQLVDYINYHHNDTRIAKVSRYHSAKPFFQHIHSAPLYFRGSGLKLNNYINNQVFPLVKGGPTLALESKDRIEAIGHGIALLVAVEGTNNARAVLCGSLDFFSDEFWNIKGSGNKAYIQDLLGWLDHTRGGLVVSDIKFGLKGSSEQVGEYTVEDEGWFEVKLQEKQGSKLVPFVAHDIELQFVMLDPYIRQNLTHVGEGKYRLQFRAPVQHGVFTFKLEVARPGFYFLNEKRRVTVRTRRHDQYPRFIAEAYPYYSAMLVCGVATALFFLAIVYHRPQVLKKKED